jgi:hypothetical protein
LAEAQSNVTLAELKAEPLQVRLADQVPVNEYFLLPSTVSVEAHVPLAVTLFVSGMTMSFIPVVGSPSIVNT